MKKFRGSLKYADFEKIPIKNAYQLFSKKSFNLSFAERYAHAPQCEVKFIKS